MLFHSPIQRYMLVALISLAPTQGLATEITNLKESVAYALQHNRMLSVSSNQVAAARAQADISTGQLLPRVDVSTGLFRTDSALNSFGTKLLNQNVSAADFDPATLNNPTEIDNYQTRLGLTMPLFNGAAWAARSSANHHAQAAELGFTALKQQLIFNTITTYVQARQANAQLDAQKNAVNAAEKRWLDAKAIKKRGMSIQSDVMDAHVHLLRSQVALTQAQGAVADSLESLAFILGDNNFNTINTLEEKNILEEPDIFFAETNIGNLLELAITRRADYLALQSGVEAAAAKQKQAQAGYLPNLNLMAAQEWNNDSFGLKNSNTTIGINLSLNIFAGGADSARSRAAESQHIILGLQLEDKQQQIHNQIRQAWRSVETSRKRLLSETEAQKQTNESLRIKSLRHQQGLEKTSDVLDAQVRADAANVSFIRAKYDFIIAKAALLLAAGTLNEEVVQ